MYSLESDKKQFSIICAYSQTTNDKPVNIYLDTNTNISPGTCISNAM